MMNIYFIFIWLTNGILHDKNRLFVNLKFLNIIFLTIRMYKYSILCIAVKLRRSVFSILMDMTSVFEKQKM